MPPIKTVYICNHTHTDIGFTDYQDVCFRQHAEFYGQALDLIEATSDYPDAARYRWTCETTGPLMRWLRRASTKEVERFLTWHRAGRIDVAGMQYNFTPLLDVEQMHRSLYPLRALREDFGIQVEAAMQDDVNGVSWLFADLLADVGISFYTAAVNPIRGARPKPFPGAFWWEGPSGKKVLAWNGFHYLFGRSQARLGDWDLVDRFLPRWIEQLENDPDYPYDFLYCESTHPIRVDNGPPDPRMPDFVRRWNEEGRSPRLEFITVTDFGRMLQRDHGASLATQRGDWTDHWTDGPASSSYETGMNRATHELMLAADTLHAWGVARGHGTPDPARMAHAYEQATLYDEHTWGAYTSIEAPNSLFTRAQWNQKANFAYKAAMETHDLLTRATNGIADDVSDRGPQGAFNLGDLEPEVAFPPSGVDELLIVNTLPWERTVVVEEPQARGAAAPAGVLDTFFNRETGWGGAKPITPMRRVTARVPASGYAFVPTSSELPGDDLVAEGHSIENARYRIRIDARSGAIAEFYDKTLAHDFASEYQGFGVGQYVYERVDSPEGHIAIADIDFNHPNFFNGRTDTPWVRSGPTAVAVHPATAANGRAEIVVDIEAAGISGARCRIWLESRGTNVHIDWTLQKLHVTEPEAVFFAFPFALAGQEFTLDLNGIPAVPNDDQLDGAAKDWYPVRRWIDVSDGSRGVTMVPVHAPLVQIGGITSGLWNRTLAPEGPTVMSWAINNHWLVNFKASQGGEIPFHFVLTTHDGPLDVGAASRFAAEAVTPAIAVRDRRRHGPDRDSFFHVPSDLPVHVTAKPAEDLDGVVLRVQNYDRTPHQVPLTFTMKGIRSAHRTDPLERDLDPLERDGTTVLVQLKPLAIQTIRVRF